jgi:mRNA interferase YafQ
MLKRGKDEEKLSKVIGEIIKGRPLPIKYKDHSLAGNWTKRRDCHIEPNWILIYYIKGNDLILERTGTHSDLFK